jgi:hypothetical protein
VNLLSTVPGAHVGAGAMSLPDAASSTVEKAEVTLDAEHAGWVTITYERRRFQHGKSTHWAWVALSAVRAISASSSPAS